MLPTSLSFYQLFHSPSDQMEMKLLWQHWMVSLRSGIFQLLYSYILLKDGMIWEVEEKKGIECPLKHLRLPSKFTASYTVIYKHILLEMLP